MPFVVRSTGCFEEAFAAPESREAEAQQIVGEADELIRRRLKELGFQVRHVVVAVTPQGKVILRSNVSADVLRSFGSDLTNLADELTATPKEVTRRTD